MAETIRVPRGSLFSELLRLGTAALRPAFIIAGLWLSPLWVYGAEIDALPPYQARAKIMVGIAQYTEWPKEAFSSDSAPFVLGILGDDPFKDDIKAFNDKRISGHKLVVKYFSTPREAANCHLLFISSSEASRLASILEALENSSVMTVADIEGFSDRNGIIHFVDVPTKDGPAKIGFKINRKAAEKAKLRINSQLLARSSK